MTEIANIIDEISNKLYVQASRIVEKISVVSPLARNTIRGQHPNNILAQS